MNSKKIDQFLLAMGVVLIFISSYQLFLFRLTQSEGLRLGTLEHAEAVVKIKNTLALDWRDAYSGFDVIEQQLIYTDKDSSAEVKFLQGHKITISENSLIRIASVDQYGGVNVQKGFIRAKIQGNKPLLIEVNGSEFKLTGENADVQISHEGNKGEIGVLSGEVSVENEGLVERIDKSSALSVNEGRFEKHKISFSLLEPLLSQTIYTLNASEKVVFKWDPSSTSNMKISEYPSFKKSKIFPGEGSAIVELTPGSYYWKVENEKGSSLIGRFGLVREIPPEILRPVTGANIKLPIQMNTDPQIFLQWKGVVGQDYLVEWVDSSSHSQKIKAHGLIIPIAASGPLQWRVKLDSAERSQAQWSEWQKLEITLVDLPTIPTDLLPEELELQSYSNEEFDVELSWKSLIKTELEIIGPRNERTLQELQRSTYFLKAKNPGTYRWRVRGKDEFLRLSEWSSWKTFTLEDLSHEVSTEGFQRIQLKKPDQSVTFSWKAAAETKTIFELSESKEFTDVVVTKEVSAAEVKIVIPKTGNFYWRSRQYLPDGTFNVSEPKKVIIEPAPAPLKPQKLPDLEVPIEWRETSSPKSRWWNFLISEAIADDFKGVAKIQLPINEDAKKYVVKIFRDAEGSELLIEKTVDEPAIEWENAKAGHYYWQYALIDFWGRQSPFSDLSSLSVTGSEPIVPEKPKLLSPIRAAEVEEKGFKIKWSPSDKNKNYRLEVSRSEDFDKPLIQKMTSENELNLKKSGLRPGLYYWRVTASSISQKEVVSNTGRFTVVPPLEKIAIIDRPEAWGKKYNNRISFAWAPSMDSYEFTDEGSKGEIDGNSLNAFEARGLHFTNQFIFAADLLRQSGKVFEGEKYLFQRLQVGATWKMQHGNHLWGPGVSAGFVSGFSYEINNDVVGSSSVSGPVYGPHLQGFYALSSMWELQGKLSYMLGAIPHVELMTEANRQMKNFYIVIGVGYSMRDYAEGDASQTSMRLNLGLGKEF